MRKPLILIALPLLLCVAAVPSAHSAEPAADPGFSEVDEAKLGYFFGFYFGNLLKEQGSPHIDLDEMRKGIMDSVSGKASALTPEEQQALMAAIRKRQSGVQEGKMKDGQQASQGYMAQNAKNDGVKVTASGLQYKVVSDGTGKSPSTSDQVVVHYRGKLIDGKEFDSSYKRNEPAEFRLSQVIAGWTEGLQLMKTGAKYQFVIPPELGYGAGGVPRAGIPANAVLIFDVELLEIK